MSKYWIYKFKLSSFPRLLLLVILILPFRHGRSLPLYSLPILVNHLSDFSNHFLLHILSTLPVLTRLFSSMDSTWQKWEQFHFFLELFFSSNSSPSRDLTTQKTAITGAFSVSLRVTSTLKSCPQLFLRLHLHQKLPYKCKTWTRT